MIYEAFLRVLDKELGMIDHDADMRAADHLEPPEFTDEAVKCPHCAGKKKLYSSIKGSTGPGAVLDCPTCEGKGYVIPPVFGLYDLIMGMSMCPWCFDIGESNGEMPCPTCYVNSGAFDNYTHDGLVKWLRRIVVHWKAKQGR